MNNRKRPRNYKLAKPVKVLVASSNSSLNSILKRIHVTDRLPQPSMNL